MNLSTYCQSTAHYKMIFMSSLPTSTDTSLNHPATRHPTQKIDRFQHGLTIKKNCFIFPINFTFRMKRRTFMRWVSHSIQPVVFIFFLLTCLISENGIPVDKILKGLKFNNYGVVNVCETLKLIVLVKVSLLFN